MNSRAKRELVILNKWTFEHLNKWTIEWRGWEILRNLNKRTKEHFNKWTIEVAKWNTWNLLIFLSMLCLYFLQISKSIHCIPKLNFLKPILICKFLLLIKSLIHCAIPLILSSKISFCVKNRFSIQRFLLRRNLKMVKYLSAEVVLLNDWQILYLEGFQQIK